LTVTAQCGRLADMALTTCPDCKSAISDAASAYPHCGSPQRAPGSVGVVLWRFVTAGLAVAVGIAWLNDGSNIVLCFAVAFAFLFFATFVGKR